jgi:hypothetical protein
MRDLRPDVHCMPMMSTPRRRRPPAEPSDHGLTSGSACDVACSTHPDAVPAPVRQRGVRGRVRRSLERCQWHGGSTPQARTPHGKCLNRRREERVLPSGRCGSRERTDSSNACATMGHAGWRGRCKGGRSAIDFAACVYAQAKSGMKRGSRTRKLIGIAVPEGHSPHRAFFHTAGHRHCSQLHWRIPCR